MRLIKIFSLIFAMAILFCSQVQASPLQVARLPIIFQSNKPDSNTCAILETKLARAVNVPLNGTLKLVEYIEPAKSTAALNEIWRQLRRVNKNAKLKNAMRLLSDKLNADIIVCPILRQYSEQRLPTAMTLESHLVSVAAATLIVYDRRTNDLVEKKFTRQFNGNYNRFGTASALAIECFDRLIQSTKLRQKFMAIK